MYIYQHTQSPNAFSASTLCLSKSFSVAAGQAMHGRNRQTRQHKQGTYYTSSSLVGTLKAARKLPPLDLARMPTHAPCNQIDFFFVQVV
jgi:hypothetical protein